MKKLRVVSTLVLIITVIVFILWHFVVTVPDWVAYANGILMLAALFTTVFSTVRAARDKK